jgi:hypothetical protein
MTREFKLRIDKANTSITCLVFWNCDTHCLKKLRLLNNRSPLSLDTVDYYLEDDAHLVEKGHTTLTEDVKLNLFGLTVSLVGFERRKRCLSVP